MNVKKSEKKFQTKKKRLTTCVRVIACLDKMTEGMQGGGGKQMKGMTTEQQL